LRRLNMECVDRPSSSGESSKVPGGMSDGW